MGRADLCGVLLSGLLAASCGVRSEILPGSAPDEPVDELVFWFGASNLPMKLGREDEMPAAYGPNGMDLGLPQGPLGPVPGVWHAGFKGGVEIAPIHFGWQYLQCVGRRRSETVRLCGPTITFGRALADAGKRVAVFEYGVGGATLGAHFGGEVGIAARSLLVEKTEELPPDVTLVAAFGLIGGNDARDPELTANFSENLARWSGELRGVPIAGAQRLRLYLFDLHEAIAAQLPHADAVRAHLRAFTLDAANNAELIDTTSLFPGTPEHVVDIHYTTLAATLLGEEAAERLLAHRDGHALRER